MTQQQKDDRERYEQETRKLKELYAERERITAEILATQRRVVAWATLLELHGEETSGLEMLGKAMQRGRLTDTIRQILATSKEALSAKGIVTELERLGFPISVHSNPLATVNAVCNRLVEQGFAREVNSRGKSKSWEKKN